MEVKRGLGFGAPNRCTLEATQASCCDDGEEPEICPISSPNPRCYLAPSWLWDLMAAAKGGPAGPSMEAVC